MEEIRKRKIDFANKHESHFVKINTRMKRSLGGMGQRAENFLNDQQSQRKDVEVSWYMRSSV